MPKARNQVLHGCAVFPVCWSKEEILSSTPLHMQTQAAQQKASQKPVSRNTDSIGAATAFVAAFGAPAPPPKPSKPSLAALAQVRLTHLPAVNNVTSPSLHLAQLSSLHLPEVHSNHLCRLDQRFLCVLDEPLCSTFLDGDCHTIAVAAHSLRVGHSMS